MSQKVADAAKRTLRTRTLLDARWQIGIACAVTSLVLIVGAAHMLLAWAVSSDAVAQAVGPKNVQWVMLGADVLFFLGTIAVIHRMVVKASHSVVGPAFAIERGLWQVAGGDLEARFRLRDGDYLTGVASAAQAVLDVMQEREGAMRDVLADMRDAGHAEGDVGDAVDRLEDLLGVPRSERAEERAEAAAEGERFARMAA